jgi:hypothetical protein
MMTLGCSTTSNLGMNPDSVRQHADREFQQLKLREQSQQQSDLQSSSLASTSLNTTSLPAPSGKQGEQIPMAEIGHSDGEYIRATGYGALAKGLYLCQHSADLAARVELSKLVRVQVTEKSVDRIREQTGKDVEQDIEIIREGLVNEVLSEVRIVERKVDNEAGTCSSTAVIPKRNLFPIPASHDTGIPRP